MQKYKYNSVNISAMLKITIVKNYYYMHISRKKSLNLPKLAKPSETFSQSSLNILPKLL